MKNNLIERLLKRAEIRRQIKTRRSVINGEPDRIADLLEEAAEALKKPPALTREGYCVACSRWKGDCKDYLEENDLL